MAEVTVNWTPKAKGRPRVRNNIAYTDPKTRAAEADVRAAYIAAAKDAGAPLKVEGPIGVKIKMGNDKFTIEIIPTVEYTERKLRGDIDNYAKLILDALNGTAFVDDRQITHLEMEKL